MKKFINFLSLALIAMLSFASCSSDNNEPSTPTPANYLVGKTFIWGDEPKAGVNNWIFSYFRFTNSGRGTFYHEAFDKQTASTSDYKKIEEMEFTYTYVKPTLTITVIKVLKATILENGITREDPNVKNAIGKSATLIVDEDLNILTYPHSEGTQTLTLKK